MTDEKTLAELLDDLPIAMFTTRTADGGARSVPMSRQDDVDGRELWFITARDTEHVAELQVEPRVHLTFASRATWVALDGRAEVVDDLEKLRELWNAFAEAWLPDGPESDQATLIRVDVEKAEYWDTPGGNVASALSFVKSKVTGDTLDSDHGTITP